MKNTLALKVPPLAQVLVLAGAMYAVTIAWPGFTFALPYARALALVIAAAGAGIALAGVLAFGQAQTTVNPLAPETTARLVNTGIYRCSRNPMYAGFLLFLLALAVFLANALAFLALPVFVWYMNRFQIAPEEAALRAKFGDAFTEYCATVRRWF